MPSSGTLQHRLVIPAPASSYAPGDAVVADTDFYITSKRRTDHPWIADDGNGRADIAFDGQRLDPALGHARDGEIQVRVIDVPEPLCNWSVDLLGGDNIFDDVDEWTEETSLGVAGCTNPLTGTPYIDHQSLEPYCVAPVDATQIVAGSHMNLGLALLFNWNDDHQGNSPYGNPSPRGVWQTRTMTGLTPGDRVGITLEVNALLNGNADWEVFMQIIGTTTNEWSGHLSDVNFWNFGAGHYTPAIPNLFLSTVVPPSGEVEIRLGCQNMSPSGNINLQIEQVQFMLCVPALNGGAGSDPDRYVTSWLADANARQQLLGRPAYLEESEDGGSTYTRVAFAGYVKSIVMERSLTYAFTLGDAGRGRRVSRAWAGVSPIADFVP